MRSDVLHHETHVIAPALASALAPRVNGSARSEIRLQNDEFRKMFRLVTIYDPFLNGKKKVYPFSVKSTKSYQGSSYG